MSKTGSDAWVLSESPPESPAAHSSDACQKQASPSAVGDAPPEPAAAAPEAPAAETQLISAEMEEKTVMLRALIDKAFATMDQLEADLAAELNKTISEFQDKMKELKQEMTLFVQNEWQGCQDMDVDTRVVLHKLARFNDQLATCARRADAATPPS